MKARLNPLATSRILRVRYQFEPGARDALFRRLQQLHYRGAIVGSHGCGKTTLLEDLEPHLAARGFRLRRLFLTSDQPELPRHWLRTDLETVGPADCLLVDGADLMSGPDWRRFEHLTRRAGSALVTSHHPGLMPTLHACLTSAALLADILQQLIPDPNRSWDGLAVWLWRRHSGNLRDALREMYDWYAQDADPMRVFQSWSSGAPACAPPALR